MVHEPSLAVCSFDVLVLFLDDQIHGCLGCNGCSISLLIEKRSMVSL